MLNYISKTELEQFEEAQEDFKKLMPFLRGLTLEEQRTLIHKIQNDSTKNVAPGLEDLEGVYNNIASR